jgi:hypothetical protein
MSGPIRLLVHVLASVALLSGILVFVGTTTASAEPTWSAPSNIDGGEDGLAAVSCPSASFCVAANVEGDAFTYNGSSWSAKSLIDNGGITAVSCGSVSFCVAVDEEGDALTYNGSSWSAPSNIDGVSTNFMSILPSVSCPSASFCVAVDIRGNALTYNGSSWSAPSHIDATADLNWVSCESASICVAVDLGGNILAYNGSSWTAPTDIDDAAVIQATSCASTTFCVAIDKGGNALTYNGSSWSAPKDIDGRNGLFSVSCQSASFCVAVDNRGNALTYNGSSWSAALDIDGSNQLFSVSCPSASFCAALDFEGNAFTDSLKNPPTTSVLIPSHGATLSGTAATLDAAASSNATSVEFWILGGSFGFTGKMIGSATSTPYGWLASWNTTSVPNGSYALVSEASDVGGNTFSAGVGITVKNSPPTTSVLIPSNGATLSGRVATLDASASNATSVEFWILGGSFGFTGEMIATATSTPYGWVAHWDTASVPNGSYALVSEALGGGGSTFSAGVGITVAN